MTNPKRNSLELRTLGDYTYVLKKGTRKVKGIYNAKSGNALMKKTANYRTAKNEFKNLKQGGGKRRTHKQRKTRKH